MTPFTHPLAAAIPLARSGLAIAFVGAALLVAPIRAARADSAPMKLAQAAAPAHPAAAGAAAAGATESKPETVEQRITSLHAALKITPEQEPKWKAVGDAMRQNATAMEKLIAETNATSPKTMTAVDDLNTYRKFAQAHVDGLKNLIDDFKVLYGVMPAAQKKVADDVFKTTRD